MFMTRLPRRINMCLIRSFERNRLSYMVLVFPVYQLLALLGIGAVSLSFDAAAESVYFLFLCVAFVILIGVPILMSWHLSCLLFFVGYFGSFAWLGLPLAPWVTRKFESIVN